MPSGSESAFIVVPRDYWVHEGSDLTRRNSKRYIGKYIHSDLDLAMIRFVV